VRPGFNPLTLDVTWTLPLADPASPDLDFESSAEDDVPYLK
jgi:hypothetical protein